MIVTITNNKRAGVADRKMKVEVSYEIPAGKPVLGMNTQTAEPGESVKFGIDGVETANFKIEITTEEI